MAVVVEAGLQGNIGCFHIRFAEEVSSRIDPHTLQVVMWCQAKQLSEQATELAA